MGWSIRKSKKFGPFRVSVGKTGFSTSVGVKGARVRVNSKGRVYGSVGAMGLRAEQRLDGGGGRRASPQAAATSGAGAALTGCFSIVGLVAAASVLLVCSGMLIFSSVESTPTRPARVAGSSADAPASQPVLEEPARKVAAVVALPPLQDAASTLVAEKPPVDRDPGTDGAPEAAPAEVVASPAEHPLGPLVLALAPELNEEPRPWVDSTGRHSVVAVLVGPDGDAVKLRNPDGKVKSVPLAKLSDSDAAYARLRLAPRVDPTADIMLGTVVSIGDGDTIELRTIDEKTKKIRLEGIDAPESGQPFGTRSKERLGELVFQKDVRVEVSELDRYGRYLGQIYVNGRWVNQAMIRSGMAWHYLQYSKDPKLAQAESLARNESLGVWSASDSVAPWDWRRGGDAEAHKPGDIRASRAAKAAIAARRGVSLPEQTSEYGSGGQGAEEKTVYVTKTGAKYHRAGCRYLKSSIAMAYSEASRRYSPCSQCKP